MSDIKGYTPLTDAQKALANEGKELEERYLRWLDKLAGQDVRDGAPSCDPGMIELARVQMHGAAMWAIRSIFQPTRIKLPEDSDG